MTKKVFNMEGGLHSAAAYSAFENRAYGSCVASTDSFVVTAGTGMNARISPGDGLIDTGLNFARRIQSDAQETVSVEPASTSFNRIDSVVAYIDTAVTPTTSVVDNTNGVLKFASVAGTAASTPQAPNQATIQSAIGAGNPYLVLANITIPSNATNLTNATFTDVRSILGRLASGNYVINRTYTANATYPKPADVKYIEVEVQAAGGGGGGANTTTSAQAAVAGGGGAGEYAKVTILAKNLAASTPIIVGQSGARGPAGNNSGGDGGNSAFGALTCVGGGGGSGSNGISTPNAGGSGGTAGSGGAGAADLRVPGEGGNVSNLFTGAVSMAKGGASAIGLPLAAERTISGLSGQSSAPGYGAGGNGGCNTSSQTTARLGGLGGAGVVIVREYY